MAFWLSSEFTPIQSVTSAILESLLVHVIFLISDDNIEDEVSVFLSKVNVPVIVIVLSNSPVTVESIKKVADASSSEESINLYGILFSFAYVSAYEPA